MLRNVTRWLSAKAVAMQVGGALARALLWLGLLVFAAQAQAALTINSVTLNGASSVTVAPGASVTVVVNETNSGGSNWGSVRFRIYDQTGTRLSSVCINFTPNHNGNGAYSETFAITAPATVGTYNVRVRASSSDACGGTNSNQITYAQVLTVSNVISLPTVTTTAASVVTATGATLNGTVSSNGASTTVTFNYGLTTGYGSSVTASPSPLAANASNVAVSAALTGLSCNTIYHFRVVGVNSAGTSNGSDQVITTSACPTPTKLAFQQQPSNAASGASISPAVTVQIQDGGGNLINSSTALVTLAIGTNPGGGTLGGTVTVNAVAGVATFSNLSINNAGTGYTLSATSTGLTAATSNAFNITAGAASKLAFYQQPSNTPVSTAISPAVTVQIQDASGNLVSADTRNVTLSKNVCGGMLGGTTTVAAVGGVATFSNLLINAVGSGCTLSASSSPALTGSTSVAFNITALPASKVAFSVQPSNAPPNVAISPAVKVQIQDANGTLISTSSATVTLAIGANPGSGTLGGTVSVAAVNGEATFANLSINSIGNGYTLQATSSGLSAATSTAFNITSATKLAFFMQPSNTSAASAITPAVTVEIRDASNNLVSTSTDTVTVAIGNNAGPGGVLSGSLSIAAVGGVATFSNLSIDVAGNGYTLTANAAGLTGDTSVSFNITPLVCFNESFPDLGNWSVGNEGGTFGNPIVTAGRLRMTNASGLALTYATLQRLFPAFGNKVIVEFLDYAYGGSDPGADGIGIILSDAAQAPVAGAFGGSLGYAPKRADQGGDTTHPGFVGGWLGVGLDEWGNFSNNTEGRGGGAAPGFTPQAVAVRGSGSGYTGYAYLTGTGSSPGGKGIDLDFATQTHLASSGPGYKYRVIIDHSDAVHAWTSVDRDLMQGGGYVNLVPPFDAKAQPGQAAVPSNWYLSFAGATGGATNIHEIANLSICSNSQSTITLDHIEIDHAASGFPGVATPITFKACADAACTTLYLNSVTLNLSASNTSGLGTNNWASNPVTFTGGQTSVNLTHQTSAATVLLGATSSAPVALNPTTCFIGATASCSMVFSNVTFDAVQPGASPTTAIFTKLSGVNFSLDVLAVTSGAINTGFTGAVTVDLVDPTAASGNCTDTNTGLSTATNYTFVGGDQGRRSFTFNYPYAALNAKVRIRSGGVVYCSSDNFVIRPKVLTLSTTSNLNPASNSLAAGADFNLTVNAGVSAGYVGSIPVKDPTLATIRDHNNAVIAAGSLTGNFAMGSGSSASGAFQYQDVGTINFLANAVIDSAFFNQDQRTGVYAGIDHGVNGDCVFNSTSNVANGSGRFGCNIGSTALGPLGKFVPDHFTLTSGSVTAACNGFTYMGQPFGVAYTIEARNKGDVRTQKYTTLTPPYTPIPTPSLVVEDDGNQGTDLAGRFIGWPLTPTPSWVAGQYVLNTSAAVFSRPSTPVATPLLPSGGGPFDTLTLGVKMVDGSAVIASRNLNASTSTDCTAAANCDAKQLLTGNPTKIRFGILKLDSMAGSQLLDMRVPLRAMYMSTAPSQFVVNDLDNCSTIAPANIAIGNQTPTGFASNFNNANRSASSITLAAGVGTIVLTKPSAGASGKADIALNLGATGVTADVSCNTTHPATTAANLPWLQGKWGGSGGCPSTLYDRDPNASVTFGSKRNIFIYIREKY